MTPEVSVQSYTGNTGTVAQPGTTLKKNRLVDQNSCKYFLGARIRTVGKCVVFCERGLEFNSQV